MMLDGVPLAIENGAGRDILSSGMATIADATVGFESFKLTVSGFRYIVLTIERAVLEDAGVLLPE